MPNWHEPCVSCLRTMSFESLHCVRSVGTKRNWTTSNGKLMALRQEDEKPGK